MKNKIAFEEHMALEETLGGARSFLGNTAKWDAFTERLLEVGEHRIERMDATGISYALLSLNSPGIQCILDVEEAKDTARKANDRLAEAITQRPDRFGALAALPMQDPEAASAELTRCVETLGFKGAMVNGFTQKTVAESAIYYDRDEYREFWSTVSRLDVPFYLHPRMQLPSRAQNYDGHPWLMSAPWGFAVETSIHALRLCGSGLFDDFPNLKIVLGHMGENIPFGLWRLDERMHFSPRGYQGHRPLGDYFRQHFHITVSGNFYDPALRCALDVLGSDKLYFSTDYPFEKMEDASNWFDQSPVLSESNRQAIGRENARRLFKLA